MTDFREIIRFDLDRAKKTHVAPCHTIRALAVAGYSIVETDTITDLEEREREMREALDAYIKAQGRMRDKWAEGDEFVKRGLWRELHACEDAARKALGATHD